MASRNGNDTISQALAKLAAGVAGVVGGAAGGSAAVPIGLLSVFTAYVIDCLKPGADVETIAGQIKASHANKQIRNLEGAILAAAGLYDEQKTPLEELVAVLKDPDGLKKNELLRQAMEKLFERAGRQTADLEELDRRLPVVTIGQAGPGNALVFNNPDFSGATVQIVNSAQTDARVKTGQNYFIVLFDRRVKTGQNYFIGE